MALKALAPEQVAETQARLREQLGPESSAPTVENLEAIARLVARGCFEFRGVTYEVPPVSYLDGVTLQKCYNTIMRLAPALDDQLSIETAEPELRTLLIGFETALQTMNRLARPVRIRDRVKRWWYGNPFMNATITEIGSLLAFFSLRRTTSSVRLSSWDRIEHGRPILPTTSHGSHIDTQPGQEQAMDSRSRIRLTS